MPSSSPTASFSPSRISPLMNPSGPLSSPSRRVQTRKGSMCASDPWGTHTQLNMDPSRSTSCRLTIVRINEPPIQLDETPPSPQQRRHFGLGGHRRHGSGSSVNSNSSANGGNSKLDGPPRLSFANASFVPPGSPKKDSSGLPGSSAHGSRPSSPTFVPPRSSGSGGHGHHQHHHRSSISNSKPRLSPDDLVNLARTSCNPRAPALSSGSIASGAAGGASLTSYASFTALPDEFFLPFIDRASEVSALFSGPPSARLLALLEQTFSTSPISSPPPIDPSKQDQFDVFAVDPRRWTYSQLDYWIKQVDRDRAPDPQWVAFIRRCVLAHSELIWERLKGALGVPPELDADADELAMYFEEMVDVPDVMLTPEHQDKIGLPLHERDYEPGAHPAGLVEEGVVGAMSPEFPAVAGLAAGDIGPVHEYHLEEEEDMLASVSELSIEPVIVATAPTPSPSLDHPPTRSGAHRMTDISEDIREENEDEEAASTTEAGDNGSSSTTAANSGSGGGPTRRLTIPGTPSQEMIHGLCISTNPASPSLLATSPSTHPASMSMSMSMSLSSFSPLPPLASFSGSQERISPLIMDDHGRDREPREGSPSQDRDARRNSTGAAFSRDASPVLSRGVGAGYQSNYVPGYAGSNASTGSDSIYDVVGERGPGNPLFPTSFARLALGPTLSANNPNLRSPTAPPPPAYGKNPHAIRMGARGRQRGLPSWAEGWDPVKHEYAVTVASGSSVGGY